MESKNSAFNLEYLSLSSRSFMELTAPMGIRMRRSTHIFDRVQGMKLLADEVRQEIDKRISI
jgi:hypothetical protein